MKCMLVVCKTHLHAKSRGSGACPPEIFENCTLESESIFNDLSPTQYYCIILAYLLARKTVLPHKGL